MYFLGSGTIEWKTTLFTPKTIFHFVKYSKKALIYSQLYNVPQKILFRTNFRTSCNCNTMNMWYFTGLLQQFDKYFISCIQIRYVRRMNKMQQFTDIYRLCGCALYNIRQYKSLSPIDGCMQLYALSIKFGGLHLIVYQFDRLGKLHNIRVFNKVFYVAEKYSKFYFENCSTSKYARLKVNFSLSLVWHRTQFYVVKNE